MRYVLFSIGVVFVLCSFIYDKIKMKIWPEDYILIQCYGSGNEKQSSNIDITGDICFGNLKYLGCDKK